MRLFRTYILPGFVFQSVVIGGGYATGRELIEFFFRSGPIGGVLGMLVAGSTFSVVLAVSFEFARLSKAYDYRTFCRALLGRGWFLFEICYFIQLLLVLAIIGSAAGQIAFATFGLPTIVGTLGLLVPIGILTFNGSELIKKFLAGWSFLLYTVYFVLFILTFKILGPEISSTYEQSSIGQGWISGGILYSGYNLSVVPAVLFAVSGLRNRRETIGAGLIAGAIAIIPAILFFIAMMGKYPEIGDQPVPATYLMSALGIPWFDYVFQIVIFGTFVETGAAMLHAINQRLEATFAERGKILSRAARPVLALSFLIMAIIAAELFGIVALIANGYGMLTIAFIAVLVIPILTLGVWKVVRQNGGQ